MAFVLGRHSGLRIQSRSLCSVHLRMLRRRGRGLLQASLFPILWEECGNRHKGRFLCAWLCWRLLVARSGQRFRLAVEEHNVYWKFIVVEYLFL